MRAAIRKIRSLTISTRRGVRLPALLLTLFLLGVCSPASLWGAESAREALERRYEKLSSVVGEYIEGRGEEADSRLAEGLEEFFDLDLFSSFALPERWGELEEVERTRFRHALSKALTEELRSYLEGQARSRLLPLTFEEAAAVDERAIGVRTPAYFSRMRNKRWEKREERAAGEIRAYEILRYRVDDAGETRRLSFVMGGYADGSWRVLNVEYEGKNLLRDYHRTSREILKNYSLPYLVAELAGDDFVLIEDWESNETGALPKGWGWKKKDEEKKKPYEIRREKGLKYLAADDRGESVILGKEMRWNVKKFPFLSFRWRVHRIPEGADERYSQTNDSAASLSVLFKLTMGVVPVSIKYLWSSSLPVGSALRREGIGRPWMIVAESGEEHLGEWRTYVFNLEEAFRKTHGGELPDATVAVGILTDANAMASRAVADYGEIRALREADADSGIRKFLEPVSSARP